MFFSTPSGLLGPVHSLLKAPFGFDAGSSIALRLRYRLQEREDFEDLLALGCLYDDANHALRSSLGSLRGRLEDDSSLVIPIDADLSPVCDRKFDGKTPQLLGVSGPRYLSYVSIQCQLERLYDLFALRRCGRTNPLKVGECADAIKLLMLTEALALALAGLATVKRSGGQFELSVRGAMAREVLRNTWFARSADQFSQAATIALAGQVARAGANDASMVDALTERMLAQDLSIPWRRLTDTGRSLKSVVQIRTAVRLVALLSVLGLRGESLKMAGPELIRYGFDFSTVSGLIRRQSGALVTDQFIFRHGDLLSARIEGASKGLRTLFRSLEEEFGERDALRDHVGGHFFERSSIRQRIEQGEDYMPRYRIHEGFDRYQVIGGAQSECDVEFVIQDCEQGHYYFVQVKHALLGERAFFEAVVEALQKDIGKGLHQLREAKRLHDAGLLAQTLQARGIDGATPANCSFVLLHNMAQFDFQHSGDGISLYDWATFRNLLKDAECQFGRSDGRIELVRLPTPLVAKHPTSVIQRLLTEHPAYKSIYVDPWAQERATTSYEVLGRPIHIRGLGI